MEHVEYRSAVLTFVALRATATAASACSRATQGRAALGHSFVLLA